MLGVSEVPAGRAYCGGATVWPPIPYWTGAGPPNAKPPPPPNPIGPAGCRVGSGAGTIAAGACLSADCEAV